MGVDDTGVLGVRRADLRGRFGVVVELFGGSILPADGVPMGVLRLSVDGVDRDGELDD